MNAKDDLIQYTEFDSPSSFVPQSGERKRITYYKWCANLVKRVELDNRRAVLVATEDAKRIAVFVEPHPKMIVVLPNSHRTVRYEDLSPKDRAAFISRYNNHEEHHQRGIDDDEC